MRRRLGHPALALLALALLSAGCGPTPEEAAAAVIVSVPVALAVGHLFIRLLTWLWRPLLRPPLSARPALVTAAVAVAPALAAIIVGGDHVLEWVPAALWLFGTTYLTLLFVAWRLWLACDPITAGSWSFFAPLSISVLPGIPLLLGVHGDYAEAVQAGWILVGYAWLVGGPILALLLVEVFIRRHRLRAATK